MSRSIESFRKVVLEKAVLGALFAGLAACSFTGGGGSDVPNAVNGTVVSSSGDPIGDVAIHVRSKSWSPGGSYSEWTTRTDENGEFALPSFVVRPDLVLEMEDTSRREGSAVSLETAWLEDGRIPTVKLAGWGSLGGTCVSDSVGVVASDRLYIPELGREIRPDSTGAWIFEGVPPGVYAPVLVTRAIPGAYRFAPSEVAERTKTVVPPLLLADSGTGTWRGVVRGADGSVVAGAKMTWTKVGDSASYGMLAASDDSGRMVAPAPSPGSWSYRWVSPAGESLSLAIENPDTTTDRRLTLPVIIRLGR